MWFVFVIKWDDFGLQEEVDRLYIFRDHYFENYPLEKAIDKDSDVQEKLDIAIGSFAKCEGMRNSHFE